MGSRISDIASILESVLYKHLPEIIENNRFAFGSIGLDFSVCNSGLVVFDLKDTRTEKVNYSVRLDNYRDVEILKNVVDRIADEEIYNVAEPYYFYDTFWNEYKVFYRVSDSLVICEKGYPVIASRLDKSWFRILHNGVNIIFTRLFHRDRPVSIVYYTLDDTDGLYFEAEPEHDFVVTVSYLLDDRTVVVYTQKDQDEIEVALIPLDNSKNIISQVTYGLQTSTVEFIHANNQTNDDLVKLSKHLFTTVQDGYVRQLRKLYSKYNGNKQTFLRNAVRVIIDEIGYGCNSNISGVVMNYRLAGVTETEPKMRLYEVEIESSNLQLLFKGRVKQHITPKLLGRYKCSGTVYVEGYPIISLAFAILPGGEYTIEDEYPLSFAIPDTSLHITGISPVMKSWVIESNSTVFNADTSGQNIMLDISVSNATMSILIPKTKDEVGRTYIAYNMVEHKSLLDVIEKLINEQAKIILELERAGENRKHEMTVLYNL